MNRSTGPLPGSRPLEVLLVFLVFFVAGGDPPPHVNEAHYLTKAKHYWNPAFCPGDYFLDSADAHAVFYWSVGWLTTIATLPTVAWIGRVAAWGLLAWGWQRLATAVGATRFTSVVAAMLLVAAVQNYNFAGEWVVGGVEAKCFAYALVFFGLAALAADRYLLVGVFFGAAAAFHVLVGGWSVIAAAIVWAANRSLWKTTWRRAALGLAIGGILSLPGLLPALALSSQASPEAADRAAQVYVFERLPHHLAPLSLEPTELGERLFRFSLLGAVFLALWCFFEAQQQPKQQQTTDRRTVVPMLRVMQFAGASVIFCGIGITLEFVLLEHPATAARWLRYYWFRLADVAVGTAAALGLCVATVYLGRVRAAVLVAIALIAGGGHLATQAVRRWAHPVPPGASRMADVDDWKDACVWIREQTPPEAVFLIPWNAQTFKWYAHRADVAHRKDIPQDAAGVVEWARRRDALHSDGKFGADRRRQPLGKKSEQQLQKLAAQFGATHVIVENQELRFPLLYKNDSYAVYRLEKLRRE